MKVVIRMEREDRDRELEPLRDDELSQLRANEISKNIGYEEFPEGPYGMSLNTQRLGKTDEEIQRDAEEKLPKE